MLNPGAYVTDGKRLMQVLIVEDATYLMEDVSCSAEIPAPTLRIAHKEIPLLAWREILPLEDAA